MKKLLATAAVCGLAMTAIPAHAELDIDVGGYFRGYAALVDQDNDTGVAGEARQFDMIRTTELHFSGETTLDNGLTVGAHLEMEADGNRNAADGLIEESYAYFSGGWGRVNFGSEDGAAYLLQVGAPAANSSIDGARGLLNPVNYTAAGVAALGIVDYDQDIAAYDDKITYLSPVFSGFQVGISYIPDIADASTETAENEDDIDDTLGESYEAAVRYEGTVGEVGVNLGAGYTFVELEASDAQSAGDNFSDDRMAWNVGVDLDIGPFGVGVAYTVDDYGQDPLSTTTEQDDEKTFVVGVDYTTGAFKLGASYLDQEGTQNIAGNTGTNGIETERYTGGVTYTYGPGMTFHGTVSYIEHDNVAGLTAGDSIDATSVLLGTHISF